MPPQPSNRDLSEQVSELAVEVQGLKTGQAELGGRLDRLNLNGSASALIALAVAAPVLLKLADAAPRLIEVADKQADWDGFWRVVRRGLNPFKPAGTVLWLVVGGVLTAYIVNVFHLI